MNSNANALTKNPRVDVRKRNLDFGKSLTIVRTREELKKFEYFNFPFLLILLLELLTTMSRKRMRWRD